LLKKKALFALTPSLVRPALRDRKKVSRSASRAT
jgi:hypothetical protein